MRFIVKPRGKGYSLRMTTPDVLVGTENPWTSKPFGREIKLGLNTRSHAEAIRMWDIRVGQVRQLEADALMNAGKRGLGRIIDLSPESALEWRKMRDEAEDPEGLEYVLTDELEKAERRGHRDAARSFAAIVFKGAVPIERAVEQYLEDRCEGNTFGYDPLAKTTALNVRSTVKHLLEFFAAETPTLNDVTADKAFAFRTHYLPVKVGLKPQTVAKHTTLLRGLWAWAITDKRYLKTRSGKPLPNPWIVEEKGTPRKKAAKGSGENSRTAYTAEQVGELLGGFPTWGTRQGDILRLALVTGCRVDEIGALGLRHVKPDGSGFSIPKGKTDNAKRFIPVVEDAQRLLLDRIKAVEDLQAELTTEEQRLFPEWPLKPTTGKVNSVSQWFTRYRRQTLGAATDGKLAMHSFRHTWRTVARQAGAAEDRIRDLGGWEGKKDTADRYDHGLHEEQLREVQLVIWRSLSAQGYLKEF